MKIGKWIAAITATILLSSGSIALAQGKGHGKGHEKHGDDEQGAQFYKDHDREALRGWYDEHRDQLPPASQRRIVYRRGWKSNSFAAGRFLQDSRNGSSHVLKSSNGSCLLLLPTAPIW
jgi:hypothetical protein